MPVRINRKKKINHESTKEQKHENDLQKFVVSIFRAFMVKNFLCVLSKTELVTVRILNR